MEHKGNALGKESEEAVRAESPGRDDRAGNARDVKPVDVTEDSFDYIVLEAELPVLVEFWAPWCEPCSQMAPLLEELAAEVGDQAVVAKVNTDEYPELAFRLKVRGTPTFKVFIRGEEAATAAGLRTREDLLELLAAEPK